MVNRKHISSWTPCLSKRNDQITTTLAAENFPNEIWIQAIFQPKSTRNIEGVLCNLSLVSRGCFYNKSGVKSGKTWSKNRVNVTITLHNSARGWSSVEFWDEYWKEKPFKCWKDENVEGRKDQEKKEADKKHYELNLERKIAKVKENRDLKKLPYVTLMYMCIVLQVWRKTHLHWPASLLCRANDWFMKIFNCSQNFTFAQFAHKI